MSPEFNEVYEEMLAAYSFEMRRYPPFFFREERQTLRSIQKAVEEISEKQNVKLRPDAKYFLISNFHQMVAVPLTVVRGTQLRGEIPNMIRSDVEAIISTAAKRADGKEISGGLVVKTVAELWEKLSTNSAWL